MRAGQEAGPFLRKAGEALGVIEPTKEAIDGAARRPDAGDETP